MRLAALICQLRRIRRLRDGCRVMDKNVASGECVTKLTHSEKGQFVGREMNPSTWTRVPGSS